jgi:hypothetical protein
MQQLGILRPMCDGGLPQSFRVVKTFFLQIAEQETPIDLYILRGNPSRLFELTCGAGKIASIEGALPLAY